MPLTNFVTNVLSLLTILGQIFAVILIILLVAKKQNILPPKFWKHLLLFAFIIAVIAKGGSLFYSEIAGFEPCKLCWIQRIFMYPLVIVFAVGLWLKDKSIYWIGFFSSFFGALVAGYHYLLQIGVVSGAPCSVVGYSASCSQRFIFTYGYITIPMMAFTAFLLIFLLMYLQIQSWKMK